MPLDDEKVCGAEVSAVNSVCARAPDALVSVALVAVSADGVAGQRRC